MPEFDGEVVAEYAQRRAHFARPRRDHRQGIAGRAGERRRTAAHDVRLLAGDRCHRVAEKLGVFQLDVGDNMKEKFLLNPQTRHPQPNNNH
jgi:hypothetical protein